MKYDTYEHAIAREASSNDLLSYVVERLTEFNDGADIELDFVSRSDIEKFCTTLGFARLWVMETEGEVFNAQLAATPHQQVHDSLRHLSLARKHLQARISEKLDAAG